MSAPPRLAPELTRIHPSAFVAPGAVVIGDVVVGEWASVWYGVVARGDTERITIGARSNVQDNSVLHADPGFLCTLGTGVTVGHRCIVHGATVEDHCLIGMGAILMNGAVIGTESLVGAGALVPEGKLIPPRSLVLGMPGKVVRTLTDAEVARLHASADHYVANGQGFLAAGIGRR